MDSGQSIKVAVHEIKNQLAIILQAVVCLRDSGRQTADTVRTTLGYIEDAAMKVDNVVNSLVDPSRPKG